MTLGSYGGCSHVGVIQCGIVASDGLMSAILRILLGFLWE